MKKHKIGIVGGGNMGTAILRGLISQKLCPADYIFVCELNSKRAADLKKAYGVHAGDLNTIISNAEIIILAVKPQDMEDVLNEISQVEGKLFISIAAGLTTEFFEKRLGSKAKVIRVMPNLPAFINESIAGICKGKYAIAADLEKAKEVLSAIGQIVVVKESMMDAVTAVSGSGPAYVFLFVEQWMAAAIALGFSKEEAKQLVYKTLVGSAHLLEKSEFSAADLRVKVTSKGGTTQAAMDVFSKGKFDQLIYKALLAAKNRAKQLSK